MESASLLSRGLRSFDSEIGVDFLKAEIRHRAGLTFVESSAISALIKKHPDLSIREIVARASTCFSHLCISATLLDSPSKQILIWLCQAMGAKYCADFTNDVTHLVCGKLGSDKFQVFGATHFQKHMPPHALFTYTGGIEAWHAHRAA